MRRTSPITITILYSAAILVAGLTLIRPMEVQATPLDLDMIPGETCWVAHLDFDALRQASWFDLATVAMLSKPEAVKRIREVRDATGIDLLQDIRSLTFFGQWDSPEEGVVLVRADNIDAKRLRTLISEAPEFSALSSGTHELLRFRDQGFLVNFCIYRADLVVISRNTEHLRQAIRVLDHEADALSARSSFAMLEQNPDRPDQPQQSAAMILLGLRELDQLHEWLDAKEISPIVRHIQSLGLMIGEQYASPANREQDVTENTSTNNTTPSQRPKAESYVHLSLQLDDPKYTQDFTMMLRGAVSAARLHFCDDQTIIDALSAIAVRTVDDAADLISIDAHWPTRDLLIELQMKIMESESEK